MKSFSTLLFTLLVYFGLNAQEITHTWYIADAKIACSHDKTVMSCLKIRTSPDSTWQSFPYEIEGFIFEPGVETRVEVVQKVNKDSAVNAPLYTYTLVRTLETKNTVLTDKTLLYNNRFRLINIQEQNKQQSARKSNAYIVFSPDSNKITGFGGCNNFRGSVQVENAILRFGLISSTKMSCMNDEMEAKLMIGLLGRAEYYVRNNMLFIACENGTLLHLRPEKRLDSIIAILNTPPTIYDGNTYMFQGPMNVALRLDSLAESGRQPMMFSRKALTIEDQKTISYHFVNVMPGHPIAEVQILKKKHKTVGVEYALVIFSDGRKKTVPIRNVM